MSNKMNVEQRSGATFPVAGKDPVRSSRPGPVHKAGSVPLVRPVRFDPSVRALDATGTEIHGQATVQHGSRPTTEDTGTPQALAGGSRGGRDTAWGQNYRPALQM